MQMNAHLLVADCMMGLLPSSGSAWLFSVLQSLCWRSEVLHALKSAKPQCQALILTLLKNEKLWVFTQLC
uniref:Secreted protein n=1 Tax=Anguilla anguilla TaxID=7936 RepID=A0A0E9UUM0_ANGAN